MGVRFNSFDIERFDSDENGVKTVVALARVPGPLRYRNADGSERVELVTSEFLRKLDSNGFPIAGKLAAIPVTLEHPPGLLRNDADLVNQYRVGETKPKVKVYQDGRVQVEFEVFDSVAQDAIRNGEKRGVSLGYRCGIERQDGEWNGIRFDAVQSEPFEADHLAIVARPRAPEALITRHDSADDVAWQITPERIDAVADQFQIELNGEPFMVPKDLYMAIKAEMQMADY